MAEESKPNPYLEQAPLWALAAILVSIPLAFKLDTHDQFELPKLVLLRVLSSLALGLWLARLWSRRHFQWRSTPLDLAVLAWGAWHLVKTVHSYSPWLSWRGEYENFAGSLTQLNYCLLFFLATQVVTRWQQAAAILRLFVATTTVVCMYALMQAMGMDFIGWAADSVIQDRFFSSLGNPNFLGGMIDMALPAALALLAAPSLMRSRKTVAAYWAMLAAGLLLWTVILPNMVEAGKPIFLKSFMRAQASSSMLAAWSLLAALLASAILLVKRQALWAGRLLLAASSLAMAVALFNTGTRGAFLGILAGLAVLLFLAVHRVVSRPPEQRPQFFKRKPGQRLAGIIVAGFIAALVFTAMAMPRATLDRFRWSLSHPAQAMDQSRWQIWGPALGMIADHPVTGMGVDTFKTMFPRYSGSKFARYDGENVSSRMAHSVPLQVAATLGLVGLALWAWFLLAWILCWWRRWRAEDDPGLAALLAGLAAAWAAYHAQNLVSFGVASITTPYWIISAILFALGPASKRPGLRLGSFAARGAALAALACALLGPWMASRVFYADKQYNFGHMVTGQSRSIDSMAGLSQLSLADYALSEISQRSGLLSPEAAIQVAELEKQYLALRQQLSRDPSTADQYRGQLGPLSGRLLFLLSAVRQEQGVALCPSEVKYHVFLGLAYEECMKRAQGKQRQEWFEKARDSYRKGVELNPENAYYRGNLGRLYGSLAEKPGDEAMLQAETWYGQAIDRAGVTPLFYENLNLLYAQLGMAQKVLATSARAADTDATVGGRVYFSAGGALFQVYRDKGNKAGVVPGEEKKGTELYELRVAAREAMEKSVSFDPKRADAHHNLAVYDAVMGNRQGVKQHLLDALKLEPGYKRSLDLARDLKLDLDS